MSRRQTRRCVIYARISISKEESVSVKRQLEAGRSYAESRGWTVVGEFVDEGVSASEHKPEKRTGWRALLDSTEPFDAVIVWKVDRLARKVLDFLHADEDLQKRGAGLVAVEQSIDMTTPMGRMVAQVLAIFAEYEASEISARVAAARTHLLKNGRAVGGGLPYGWRNIDNPDGPGKVLAQDPERIDYVRTMVARAQRGDSVYSIAQHLDAIGAPLPAIAQSQRKRGDIWHPGTVERLLRHPFVAGAIPFNPGNTEKGRGGDLLRDENGLPVVYEDLAILPLTEWRALVAALDSRDSPQARPRAMRSKTSGLFSGLIYCGDPRHDEPRRMWRGTVQGREGYVCQGPGGCHHSITNFEPTLIDEFLRMKGDWPRWSKVKEVHESALAVLPEIEHRLTELDVLIREANDRDERNRLRDEQDSLLDLRDQKRAEPGRVIEVWNPGDHYFSELWANAESVEDRRAVLDDALERVVVRRGKPGRRTAAALLERLDITWIRPDEVGPRPLG